MTKTEELAQELAIRLGIYPNCCDKIEYKDCKANKLGSCIALNDTTFINNECPFYSESKIKLKPQNETIFDSIDTIEFMEWLIQQPRVNRCYYMLGTKKYDITWVAMRKVIRELRELRRIRK